MLRGLIFTSLCNTRRVVIHGTMLEVIVLGSFAQNKISVDFASGGRCITQSLTVLTVWPGFNGAETETHIGRYYVNFCFASCLINAIMESAGYILWMFDNLPHQLETQEQPINTRVGKWVLTGVEIGNKQGQVSSLGWQYFYLFVCFYFCAFIQYEKVDLNLFSPSLLKW